MVNVLCTDDGMGGDWFLPPLQPVGRGFCTRINPPGSLEGPAVGRLGRRGVCQLRMRQGSEVCCPVQPFQ